jgi:hypothetical protein
MVEVGIRSGDVRNMMERSNKRKIVSPIEDRKIDGMKRAKLTLRLEKATTFEANGLSRWVGKKQDGVERGETTRKGGHRLTKSKEKGCLEFGIDPRPSW